MTVDLLEEEMNILNLNGLSVQDVTDNINYLRMTGLEDNVIREQYDDLLSELKPITKTSPNDTQNIKEWTNKGSITPFEYGRRKSLEFDEKYNNINEYANLSNIELKLKNTDYNNTVDERIAKNKKAKEERNKRVNEGNASFLDRTGAFLDRWGKASLEAQLKDDKQTMPISPLVERKKRTEKIDFAEGLQNSFENMSWLPFIGGFIENADTQKEREIRKHILNGEAIRQDELDFLNKRLEDIKEQNVRGITIGGQIAESLLPSMIRFGSEMATGSWVLQNLRLAPQLAEGATLGQKIKHGVKTMALTGSANTLNPLTSSNEIYSTYQKRMNENEISLSKNGQFIFNESVEKPATAFLKSIQEVFIMFASEGAGELIGIPVKGLTGTGAKYVATPISRYLKENTKLVDFVQKTVPELSKKFEQMNNLPIRGTNVDWLKDKVKFDGFIEEIGEEVLEDVLNLTLGTHNEEKNLENYAKAIFKSPDEWAVIVGAVALQGTSLSVASHIIGSNLEANGASNEEIQEVMQNLTEDDKKKLVEELISSSNVELNRVRTDKEISIELQSNEVKDKVFSMLTEKGMDEEQADAISKLFKARSKIASKWSDSPIQWFNNLGLDVNYNNQKNYVVQRSENIYNDSFEQSAMYASNAKSFDDFYDKVLSSDKNRKNKEQYNLKTKNNNFLRVPFDTVLHDKNNHNLTKEEWNEVIDNIDNPVDFEYSNKSRFAGKPILLKIKTKSGFYGAVVETFENNNPIVTTVFKDNENNIDNWLKKERPPQTKNTSSVTTKGLLLSKGLNNIITNIQPGYNPNVKYNEQSSNNENTPLLKGGIEYNQSKNVLSNTNENIYYQSVNDENVVDLTNDFEKTPTIEEVKAYINEIIENGTKFATLSNDWFVDIRGGNRIKKKILNASNYKKLDKMSRKRHNKYIMSLEKLLANAEYIGEKENTKKDKKPNIAKYHYFKTNVKIGDKTYEIIFDTEEYTDKKSTSVGYAKRNFKETEVDTNSITDNSNDFNINAEEYKNDNPQGAITNTVTSKEHLEDNSIITDNSNNLNPKTVHLYNISERKRPQSYYQSAYNEASALFDKFGQSEEELTNMILADVKNTILENNLSEEEFNLVGVKLYGSFSTGKNNNNSDIDFLVEYSGSMREDDAFNMFADLKLKIPDKNGKNIKVDINPIKADVSGTIDDYIEKNKNFVKTYYQGDSHKIYQLSRKDGNNVIVEYYDNSDIEEVKPLNIRNLKFKNVQNVKEIKKTDIKNAVFGTKEKILIQNKKSKINAVLTLNNLKKIISSVFSSDKQNTHARLEKEIISNVETIFENAIPILKHNELKNENLYDTQIIHRFALPVKIGGNNFLTMITVKERKDFKEMAIDEFAIYDLNSKITYKKMFDRSSMSEDLKKSGQSRSQTSNISMTDILDFVNSNLDKYKVTLNQEGKNNEDDIDYTERIFNKINIENKEQFDDFVDNFSSEQTRASITFEYKPLNEPKAIIELFENADKSSFLHEMAHLFLQDIINASKTNDEAKRELDRINDFLGHTQGEYTRQEHEKWAKGFEVYLINGKAPSSALKSAYDTFKSWLREIYNFVISSNGTLSQDVFSVYDSLFKDYKPDDMEVIKSIVRNAINTANNAKEGIHSINDEQKRYKEVAYDILSVALNKKKAYLKTILESNSKKQAKKREEIEKQLANVSDEISSSNGMLPEWKEFFPDYGVGDNAQTKTDYDLAISAYNVITNKTYLDYDSNYNNNEIDTALFSKLEKAYNYILNIYKTGDSTQKDYAVASMYEWLDNSLPSEKYQEIFTEMFEHDFREIERLQNLDAFERAKENIANSAKMINNKSEQRQFNDLVVATLNGLSFLTANDKTKIFNNLMQYNNSEELRNNIDNIMDIAKILDSENYFKKVEAKIQKALASTKNIKQANKYVGKYTFDVNQVFSDLRRYNNMTKEKASNELELVNMFEGEEENSLSFEDKLRHKFLYYKATPSMYISSDFISDLYKDIITLKNWGFLAKKRDKLLKKVDIEVKKEDLLRVLDGKKKSNKFTQGYIQAFANWESALNAIFNNKVKEQYSLLDKEAKVQIWQNKEKQTFLSEACRIFGVSQYQFDNLMIDKLSEKYSFVEHGVKRNHNIELNKLNIIQAYIWSKNSVLKSRLERQFGEDGLNQMFSKLDNDEIEFANLMQRTASKFYNEANRVYIRKYGIELPRVENYFPSQTERVSTVDLLADFSFQSATSPSFIKNRVNSKMPMMRFSNPLTTLFGHIDKMGVFIHMTDVIDMYNKIFTDSDIKKRIISLYGEATYESFGTILANSSYQKQGTKIDKINGIFNKLVSNFVTANIILKPSIAFKQLLSTVNYAENMPVTDWTVGFLKALANPKATVNFMMQDEYLKTRFETGGQNEYLKQSIEHSRFAKTRKFIDYLSLNVKLGDMGAIVFGGKPYIDYLMKKKGMTKENAFREFRLSTMRSQQASMASSLSNFQNNFTNPWVRGLFAFRNTPNQYFRKVVDSVISYSNGDTSLKDCAKTIFIYTFLNAFLYNTATSLSILTLASGGDGDDDLFKDTIKSLFDFNSQAVPVIGDLYVYVLDRLMGMKRKGNVSIPAITDLFDIVEQLTADDVTLEDWLECLASFGDVSTGLPVQSAVNMTGGAVDVVTGKPYSGALRMFGYTKNRAEKVAGENNV